MGSSKCLWNKQEEKLNTQKVALLNRSKLNSIEKVITKNPIDSDNSLDWLTLVINEEQT